MNLGAEKSTLKVGCICTFSDKKELTFNFHDVHITRICTNVTLAKVHSCFGKPFYGILNGVEVLFKHPPLLFNITFNTCRWTVVTLRSFSIEEEKQKNKSN